VLVIVALVLPWTSFQSHSHWPRIVWVPFASPPPLTLPDVLANWLLYVPFGYFYAERRPGLARVLTWCVIWAVVLSVLTELTQVYSHGRFPSSTDVLMNGLGAWAGAGLARRRRTR
jgi:glycopeptide antibiotics resistance protein